MSSSEYLLCILRSCNIYKYDVIPDYLEKIVKLNDRKDLPQNLQNCLKQIDKKHLPEIIKTKECIINNNIKNQQYYDEDFQPLVDFYEFEKQQIFDKIYIQNIKSQFKEQDRLILSLNDEINKLKNIIKKLEIKENSLKYEKSSNKFQCY